MRPLLLGSAMLACAPAVVRLVAANGLREAGVAADAAPIVIDYPAEESIFPPDMAAPTFLWRDRSEIATTWRVDVAFADGSTALRIEPAGEPPRLGEIDPRCVSDSNERPKLTAEQAAGRAWKPDAATWAAIKSRSVGGAASVTVSGFAPGRPGKPVSRGQVRIRTSRDPVGAPIFYRDVPLMPSAGEKGVIKPLAASKVPLIAWRLRDVSRAESRLLLTGLSTCANCHSFSRDGRTLGMDLDGPKNDKGLYAIVPVRPRTTIESKDVVAWSSFRSELGNELRVGFMSQVSPNGRYVVTTIKPAGEGAGAAGPEGAGANTVAADAGPTRSLRQRQLLPLYYVANFPDYRFLQVFYPTAGILVVYDRASGELRPLPGADDPRYVHANATWSPDGTYLVFARAEAKDPNPSGSTPARYANDPNEIPIQYDLYRIPFGEGRGGRAEPIAGASRNGRSNSFARISPDGRWIIYVQARNGLLMRPDSELHIVPAQGGEARRMRCNTPLMNSWHSFSPNGRWLVFSSKSRSPYTQMLLTHVDEEGNDSPPILVEDATAANRAVNLPEFVNVPPGGFLEIDAPAAEFYRLFDVASELTAKGRYPAAIPAWRKALALNDADDRAHNSLAVALASSGRLGEAIPHFEKALALNPAYDEAYNSFGAALMAADRIDEALPHYRKALAINPENAEAESNLGAALARSGRLDEAVPHLEKAVAIDPSYVAARANLGGALMQSGQFARAVPHLEKAVALDARSAELRTSLGQALLWEQRPDEAIVHFRQASRIDPRFVPARENLANALYYLKGKTAEALVQWRKVLALEPDHVGALARAAWALATSPDPSVRNGTEAVALAERAARLSGGREPVVLDSLAAAYAEVGRFKEAVETAERAAALARPSGDPRLADGLAERLALYRSGAPVRDAH